MTAQVRRVVLGFLAGFVLLSLVPAMPDLGRQLAALDVVALATRAAVWSDALLGAAALLLALALALRIRRRVRASRADAFRAALAQHTAQGAAPASTAVAPRPLPPVKRFQRSARRPALAASELETKIRAGAKKGEKLAALARRHRLSIDAVRAALGDSLPEPSAPRGNSFRGRQQRLPAGTPAALPPSGRKPYGALA